MLLVVITFLLLGITLLSFVAGSAWLSKYAFRLGAGPGLAVLLFPPYTFYFAFYQLRVEEKDRPTALWLFGIVATALLTALFWAPITAAFSGDFSSLQPPEPEKQVQVPVRGNATAPQEAPKVEQPKVDAPTATADMSAAAPADGSAAPSDAATGKPATP
ncbi:MAG: hypothetical protein AAGI01_00385 [Myxococcota bacterium]